MPRGPPNSDDDQHPSVTAESHFTTPPMTTAKTKFNPDKMLIGMVHVGPMPGAPAHDGESVELLAAKAVNDATLLAERGFDAVIIENMHDAPYVHGDKLGPEVVAGMTRICLEVDGAVELPIGLQILSGGNRHALAVASAVGANFIRCENYVFAHVADEGLLPDAEAPTLLRYRKSIDAGDVRVFADIKKKHASHALTADLPIEEVAEGALFFGADGLIVTGMSTGKPTDPKEVAAVKRVARQAPVFVGSGVTPETVEPLFEHADGLIVGSFIKQDGKWSNPIDPARCDAIVAAARAARG